MNIALEGPLDFLLAAPGAVFALAMLLAMVRLVRGPSLPDRVVALDLIGNFAIGIIAVAAVVTNESALLSVAIVMALTLFLGTAAFASYLERRARP